MHLVVLIILLTTKCAMANTTVLKFRNLPAQYVFEGMRACSGNDSCKRLAEKIVCHERLVNTQYVYGCNFINNYLYLSEPHAKLLYNNYLIDAQLQGGNLVKRAEGMLICKNYLKKEEVRYKCFFDIN